MMNIVNYYQFTANIATSGQPTEEEFERIAQEGYEVVINLASSHSPEKLEFEDDIVTELGMEYFHIAVEWDNPQLQQFELFCHLMQVLAQKKIWLHCIANYRVSAFMLCYGQKYLNMSVEQATSPIFQEWKPNSIWIDFITQVL